MRYLTALFALAASATALAQTDAIAPAQPATSTPAPAVSVPVASEPHPAASGAGKAAPSKSAKQSPPPLQSALTAPLMYQLLLGEMTFRQDTPASAQSGIQIVLDAAQRTNDERLFKRATAMALQAHSGPDALKATRAWHTALPQSPDANRYELQVLITLGRIEETADSLRRALETLPETDRENFIIALPMLYGHVADKALAEQTVERVLDDVLKTPKFAPAAWSSIGRLRLQADDLDGALNAATLGAASNALASTPSQWPALLALLLMSDASAPGTKTAAETLVKNYLQTFAAKPQVQLGYARALTVAGRTQEALAQLEQLVQRQPDYADGWLALGSMRVSQEQTDTARTALERYLNLAAGQAGTQAGPANADRLVAQQRRADMDTARLLLARLAEKRGDVKAADQWLAAVQSPSQMLTVALQRASLLADQGQIEQGRALIRAVPDRTPEDPALKLRAEAQLLRDHQRAADAYQLLNNALKGNPDDKDLLYDAAMAAAKANRVDDEERLLRRLIELDPQSPAAYNTLGYDLADRGLRLQEAKQLVEKAVALAPGNAFIWDSLGWVQYRLGNLQEARQLLENAFKQQPDAEIAAHLGEVLWTQGERDAARTIWRQGLSLDAKNQTLRKTLERFKVPRP